MKKRDFEKKRINVVKRFLSGTCFLIILMIISGNGMAYEQTPLGLLKMSREYSSTKDFKRAKEAINRAIKIDPGFSEGWRERGKIYYWNEEYEEALKSFEMVSYLLPYDKEAITFQVILCFLLGKNDLALKNCEKLIDAGGEIPPKILLDVYKMIFQIRNRSKAENVIETYLNRESREDKKLWETFLLNLLRENPSEAKKSLDMLTNYWTDKPLFEKLMAEGYHLIGRFYLREKKYDLAIENFSIATSMKPVWYPSLRDMGWAYFGKGKVSKAVEIWEKNLQYSSNKEKTLLMIVRAKIEGGFWEEAEADLSALFEKSPDDLNISLERIKILIRKERIEEAKDLIEKIKKRNPESLLPLRTSIGYLITIGGYEDANELLNYFPPVVLDSDEMKKVERRLYISRGKDFLDKEIYSDAIRYYKKALEIKPNDVLTRKAVGWAFWKQGDKDSAISVWEKIILSLSTGKDSEIIYNLSINYAENKKLNRLKQIFEVPNSSITLWQGYNKISMLAYKRKNVLLGARLYKELLKENPEAVNSDDPVVIETLANLLLFFIKERESKGYYREAMENLKSPFLGGMVFYKALMKISNKYKRLGSNDISEEYFLMAREALKLQAQIVLHLGNAEEAAKLYAQGIHFFPHRYDLRVELIKILWVHLRQYNEAEKIAEPLFNMDGEELANNRVEIAIALSTMKKYEEAIPYWKILAEIFTENLFYTMEYGLALYWSGKTEKGLELIHSVLDKYPDNTRAILFLIDHSMAVRDFNYTAELLTKYFIVVPDHTKMRFQLGSAFYESGNMGMAIKNLTIYLEKFPDDSSAKYLLAHIRMVKGQFDDSFEIYSRMIEKNPNNFLARIKRFETALNDNRLTPKALSGAQWAMNQYSHVAKSHLNLANAFSSNKHFKRSIRVLKNYLKESRLPNIPVLNYGALSRHPFKRMFSPDRFEKHLQALKTHNYISFTGEELLAFIKKEGTFEKGSKPVVITFDDALRDTILLATPILEKFDFKAILFVSTEPIENSSPFHLTADELRELDENPLWDIQLMGHNTTVNVSFSKNGTTGNFLSHLKWNKESETMETEVEYVRRVKEDFDTSIRLFKRYTGKNPVAYHFYKGDMGQKNDSSYKKSYPLLMKIVKERFPLAVVDFLNGFSTSISDPHFITRFSVPYWWDTEKLIEHLKYKAPNTQATLDLAKNLSWNSQFEEAAVTFDRAMAMEADPVKSNLGLGNSLLWEGGLLPQAKKYFDNVLTMDTENAKAQDKIKYIDEKLSPNGEYSFDYWKDSDNRLYKAHNFDFSVNSVWPLGLVLKGKRFEVTEGVEDEFGNLISIEGKYWPFRETTLGLGINHTFYDSPADKNVWGYNGWLRFPVFGKGKITLSGKKIPEFNLISVRKGISFQEQQVTGAFRPNEWLDVDFHFNRQDYSDDNERYFLIFHPGYIFKESPNIRIGYYFRYGNSKFQTNDYYTPERAWLHQISLQFKQFHFKNFSPEFRGRAGYVRDRFNDWQFAYTVRADLTYKIIERLFIKSGFKYLKTSDYWLRSADVRMGIRF